MAAENEWTTLIRQKMIRPPNLRPKTRFGQRTIGRDPATNVQYHSLKREYVNDPARLQPFLNEMRGRILTDEQILTGEEGIYTWILKRGHLYATRLITNQEIGTLHVNMDMLTLHRNNVRAIPRNTLKNGRGANAKPTAAGELLLIRGEEGVRIYFNLQSGTYSEPMLRCRATNLGTRRGLNKKEMRGALVALKRECREEMVREVQEEISAKTGLSFEKIRFLSCDDEIQRELEAVPFLSVNYTHGACRDDDEYHETVAGRNLIRRFMAFTSAANRNRLAEYFQSDAVSNAPVLGKRKVQGNQGQGNQAQSNQGQGNRSNTRKNKISKKK
jgi:hypothetical protein